MYHGEVSVSQEDLNKFLSVAEDLEVKGLTQKQSSDNKDSSNSSSQSRLEKKSPQSVVHHSLPTSPSRDPRSVSSVSSHESPVNSVKTEPRPSEPVANNPVAKYNDEVYDEGEELYDQYDEEVPYYLSTTTG